MTQVLSRYASTSNDPPRKNRINSSFVIALEAAKARGFRAMQFNFVVSTNEAAMRLWEKLGFAIVGRLPEAFRHPSDGFVDAFVMYRML